MDVETGRDFTEEKTKTQLKDIEADAPPATHPMSFDSWAAQPVPKRRVSSFVRGGDADGNAPTYGFDLDALKIFLILAGLTAGMALGLRLLF